MRARQQTQPLHCPAHRPRAGKPASESAAQAGGQRACYCSMQIRDFTGGRTFLCSHDLIKSFEKGLAGLTAGLSEILGEPAEPGERGGGPPRSPKQINCTMGWRGQAGGSFRPASLSEFPWKTRTEEAEEAGGRGIPPAQGLTS